MGLFGLSWGGKDKQTTESTTTSRYETPPWTEQEGAHGRMAMAMMRAMAPGLTNLPGSLQYGQLGGNLIDEMFGGMGGFREMLESRDVTPEQKAAIEKAYMSAYEGALGRQEASAESARARARLQTEQMQQQYKDMIGASGLRGTTAGSANYARNLSGLGLGLAEMERGFGADRAALLAQAQGGMAGATLEYPFRERELMLRGLGAAGSERMQRLGVRTAADQARQMFMGNPYIERLFRERMATGVQRTSGRQTQETSKSLGWGDILGMGVAAFGGPLGIGQNLPPLLGGGQSNPAAGSEAAGSQGAYMPWGGGYVPPVV